MPNCNLGSWNLDLWNLGLTEYMRVNYLLKCSGILDEQGGGCGKVGKSTPVLISLHTTHLHLCAFSYYQTSFPLTIVYAQKKKPFTLPVTSKYLQALKTEHQENEETEQIYLGCIQENMLLDLWTQSVSIEHKLWHVSWKFIIFPGYESSLQAQWEDSLKLETLSSVSTLDIEEGPIFIHYSTHADLHNFLGHHPQSSKKHATTWTDWMVFRTGFCLVLIQYPDTNIPFILLNPTMG